MLCAVLTATAFLPSAAWAQDGLDTGDTAWILISTGLVLFMMIPGLAMFYAGLVQTRNVLSVFMHCFGIFLKIVRAFYSPPTWYVHDLYVRITRQILGQERLNKSGEPTRTPTFFEWNNPSDCFAREIHFRTDN